MKQTRVSKDELFSSVSVPKALLTMAVPTVISQAINLIYNMVDAFFVGRTGNSYMMAATSLTLTMVMMNAALGNLFGIGGGSHVARLMGAGRRENARHVSALSVYGAVAIAALYSLLIGIFIDPTIDYARSYSLLVVVAGSLPSILSMTLAHLLRNAGFSSQASLGLSLGGVLNMVLDPLFMFVILPRGQEVTGAAVATLLANCISCIYLLFAYGKAGHSSALCLSVTEARKTSRGDIRNILTVGVPSAVLTGLFDVANICVNMIAAAHNDLVLAGMGIVMKVERIPNAVNLGICQGMLPIVAYNFASGNHRRMQETIRTARNTGLIAGQASRLFLSTKAGDAAAALTTIGYATLFLRIRCIASPVQFINYHTSYCLQAMGNGRGTLLHAFVREIVFYIPLMFLLDRLFGETGLAAALPAGEACGAVFALWLLHRWLKQHGTNRVEKKA